MEPIGMSPRALLLIAILLGGCNTQRPLETVRTRADLSFDRGDYQAAAREYGEIVERYPGDWEAQYMLGRCKLQLDQPVDARAALEVAYTRRPGNSDVVDALAEAMFRQGDKAGLFQFLRERADSEGTVRAWLRMGRYAAELGDPDSAATAFETAIRLDEGRTTEPYLQAAVFSQQIGDLDAAQRRLRQAYMIDPEDQRVSKHLRELGEVPGPTIALPPTSP
jgi:cytochrome c-type biogenesis protein CcmH/NrfG